MSFTDIEYTGEEMAVRCWLVASLGTRVWLRAYKAARYAEHWG